jgi:hypothetical protein
LVLNVALVLLNLLPGLDLISASLVSLIARQSRRSGAEDEGRCEGNFGLGQHCRVSLGLQRTPCWYAGILPIDRTVQSAHI